MKTTTQNWASYALIFFSCIGVCTVTSCEDECGTIKQTVEVAAPDAELLALITDCKEGRVSPQSQCSGSANASLGSSAIACACLPLCERMLALVDGFPGPESLKACTVFNNLTSNDSFSNSDAGLQLGPNAFRVSLSYLPSNCHAPAQ